MNRISNRKVSKKAKVIEQEPEDEKIKEKPKTKKGSKKVKKKKVSFLKKMIRRIFLLLILVLIIVGAIFYFKVKQNGGGIQGVLCTIFGQSVENLEDLESINVLLLGVSEDIDIKLTDTIILCSYNPQKQTASMLSIPRDTFIGKNKNVAKGSDKINSLYYKNVEKTVKAVENITDVDIDYYIVVNTNALIEIVNIVNGVNFEVPINMKYDDPTQDLHINLKAGMQKIDGEKAEQLLRFRHNNDGSSYPAEYGDNDFGRMKTQRAFITETVKQTIDIKNIFKAKKIADTIFKNVETNMEKEDIYKYIPIAIEFDVDNIISEQLPGESEKCNNLWFFIHNKSQTKKVVEKLGF